MNMLKLHEVTAVCIDGTPDGSRRDTLVQIIEALNTRIQFAGVKYLTYADPSCKGLCDVIRIPKIEGLAAYSGFVIYDMPNYVTSPFCMTIHDDGFPINLDLWQPEFLHYDYIGAPWGKEANVYPDHYANGWVEGGNGGFSIRSQRVMQLGKAVADTIEKPKRIRERVAEGSIHEDGYFCYEIRHFLKHNGVRFAPYDLSKRFSLETDLDDGDNDINKVFGFHGKRHIDFASALARLKGTTP